MIGKKWGEALLAVVALGGSAKVLRHLLQETGGRFAVPLDDAYIHFQFARAFARLEPLVYVDGAGPVAGATSLLWPALLSPVALFSDSGELMAAWAWVLSWTSLGLLAFELHSLGRTLCGAVGGLLAGLSALLFGGHLWCAGSGMEVMPLAWVLWRSARRAGEVWQRKSLSARDAGELLALALAGPLLRPEGGCATLLIAGTQAALLLESFLRPQTPLCAQRRRLAGVVLGALVALALPTAALWLITGAPSRTTTAAKWLPLNPYLSRADVLAWITMHVELLFTGLMNGRRWAHTQVPAGSALACWLALPALLLVGARAGRARLALCVCVMSLGIVLPATYETFLVNRLRYLVPFAAGWLLGVVCLAHVAARLLQASARAALMRLKRSPRPQLLALLGLVPLLLLGARLCWALMGPAAWAIDDLAMSAQAIDRQQVSAARWIARHLPQSSRVGVNDAGAIAYLSGRPIFDVVGLTTAGEARHWVAGPGARFEHYEQLPRATLPTHFAVYPEWFALPALLGPPLTSRTVHATILGGPTLVVAEARYGLLGSGEAPTHPDAPRGPWLDALDVADLDSEAAHGYALLDATRARCVLVTAAGRGDAGRADRSRERFKLRLQPGGQLWLRGATSAPATLQITVNGQPLPPRHLSAGTWQELGVEVPRALPSRGERADVEITSTPPMTFLHYWSWAP